MPDPNTTNEATAFGRAVFRSRLEAHWASFLFRLRWPWSHEPVDIKGWSPDIVVGKIWRVPCMIRDVPLSESSYKAAIAPLKNELDLAEDAVGSGAFLFLGSEPFGGFEGVSTAIGLQFCPEHHSPMLPAMLNEDGYDRQRDVVIGGPPYRGLITGRSYNHGDNNINPCVRTEDIMDVWRWAERDLITVRRER